MLRQASGAGRHMLGGTPHELRPDCSSTRSQTKMHGLISLSATSDLFLICQMGLVLGLFTSPCC